MLNAKYLVFDTLNTKKPFSSGVLNAKIFSMSEQYNLKYGRIRTRMVKVLLVFYSLLSLLSHHFIPFFLSSHSSLDIPINSSLLLSLFFLLTVVASLSSFQPRHPTPQLDANLYCYGFYFSFYFYFYFLQ